MEEKRTAIIARWLPVIQKELNLVIEFWMKKSIDEEHGGFFTCLDHDGSVYDDIKYTWLQSRQVWMLMRLFNEVERFKDQTIYNAAVKGADFLFSKCRVQRAGATRCAFSMTRSGEAIKIQRTLFSECFFVMAMSETWRANQEEKYKDASVSMMKRIQKWCMEDDSELGRDWLPGCTPTSTLAVPMMALCVCEQMQECSIKWQDDGLAKWAVAEILLHAQCLLTVVFAFRKATSCKCGPTMAPQSEEGRPSLLKWIHLLIMNGGNVIQRTRILPIKTLLGSKTGSIDRAVGDRAAAVSMFDREESSPNRLSNDTMTQVCFQRGGARILENVSPTGEELPGAAGRLQIPGHAIECGWFLIEYYKKRNMRELANRAIEQFIVGPHLQGWDKLHGGLMYFIDADGLPPTQLEWNMKLWWPHNEAMIAHLMAYEFSGEAAHLDRFDQAATYAFEKFSDHKQGEWFGYLNRKGELSSRFKGGPWKGCFHVPRCLYLCEKILNSLNKE